MITGEQLTLPTGETSLAGETQEGVFVALKDRAEALGRLAAVYADYAEADGMVKALETPAHRQEMRHRYEDPDTVAAAARRQALSKLRAEEVSQAKVLVNASAFAEHGMDVGDIETLTLQTTIETRRAIGVSAGRERRSAVLDGLYNPSVN